MQMRGGEIALPEGGTADGAVTSHQRAGVLQPLAESQQLLAELARLRKVRIALMKDELSVQHLQELRRVGIVAAKFPCPVPGPAGLRRAGRPGSAVDGTQHDLQFQLDGPVIDLAVQPFEQLHRPVEHGDRLGHRRARDRELRRLDVITDGLFGRACAGEMLREDGRFRRDRLRKVAFEDRGDPGMEAAAIAQQQAFIGRILNQGVLEAVGGARRFADAEQQIGVDQLVERLAQGRRRPLRDGGEHAVGEFAADDGADLRQFPRAGIAVETCHQRTVERCRDRQTSWRLA